VSKLWDALKRAEQEKKDSIVSQYEEVFSEDPEGYSGDLMLNIPEFMREEFRKLASIIIKKSKDGGKQYKSLLISSARPGEGTSTVAVALAASIAADRQNQRVLLVDANLRNPEMHTFFGISETPGLVDVVTDYENRMKLFKASPVRFVSNLHLLTSGNTDGLEKGSVEVLNNERFYSFMREIRKFYHFIIVDSPPVNPFSDALSLSSVMDGVLLVVDSQSTRWEVAKRAVSQFKQTDADFLGVVLNKRKLHIPKSVYKRI
jgi:capsular exopolysaccharide synthesis family protein